MNTTSKPNPNTPPPIPGARKERKSSAEVNPLVAGGAVVAGGVAGATGTAMAMKATEAEEVADLSVFEDAQAVIDETVIEPHVHVHYYAPGARTQRNDMAETTGPDRAIDLAVAQIDPVKAAAEITGEMEVIDANDINEEAMISFGATETVYTENGDMTVTMASVNGEEMAMVDENRDGDYDGFLDKQGQAYSMPTAISQADVEVARSTEMDEYMAHNTATDIDVSSDDSFADDVTYV